ncbi:MAG: hypothetical protein P8Z80_19140 [Pseudolabrys sp.]
MRVVFALVADNQQIAVAGRVETVGENARTGKDGGNLRHALDVEKVGRLDADQPVGCAVADIERAVEDGAIVREREAGQGQVPALAGLEVELPNRVDIGDPEMAVLDPIALRLVHRFAVGRRRPFFQDRAVKRHRGHVALAVLAGRLQRRAEIAEVEDIGRRVVADGLDVAGGVDALLRQHLQWCGVGARHNCESERA